MNDDIRFYDFDLNLLHVLPAHSESIGYSSVNATIELNGSGSVEIVFFDEVLKILIENSPDNIIVIWRDFQGFLTSYTFTQKEYRLFGMSLNGLLHRVVIPPFYTTVDVKGEDGTVTQENQAVTGTAERLARNVLSGLGLDWLNITAVSGFTNTVEYQTSKYMTADKFIEELMELDNAGYIITVDLSTSSAKKFTFKCIKPKSNSLMLSENNLNAYEFEVNYNNKELAFGGWYEEKQLDDADGNAVSPIWKYITLNSSKSGIYKIDTVLSSQTQTEAYNELKALSAKHEISAKTKNIAHNEDYSIGDIIRVQKDGITAERLVNGISMWNETSYGEQPILKETGGN